MPFQPGKSGNPKGRKKGSKRGEQLSLREAREQIRKDTPAARRLLRKVMARAEAELKKDEVQNHLVVAGVRAAEQVMVWSYGRPSQWPDEQGIPADLLRLPIEEQERIVDDRIQAYLAYQAELGRLRARREEGTTVQ